MAPAACEAAAVNEGVYKSCAKDERLPQRRLVSTAANEVLYQHSPAPAEKHTHTDIHIQYTHTNTHTEEAHTQISAFAGTYVHCICTVTRRTIFLQASTMHDGHTHSLSQTHIQYTHTHGPYLQLSELINIEIHFGSLRQYTRARSGPCSRGQM